VTFGSGERWSEVCRVQKAEGGGGILKRVRAFRLHHGIEDDDCPLTMIRHPADLLNHLTAESLVACRSGLANPELLVLDTWSRCLPGGNESATEDTTTAVNTIDTFRHETGCPMIVVHHSPLSNKERPRGSTALFAAADIGIAVDRVGHQRVAKMLKNRDGETDLKLSFKLNSIEIGRDQRDRPITSCVVEQADEIQVKLDKPLTAHQKRAHGALVELVNKQQEYPSGDGKPPTGATSLGVAVNAWREEFYRRCVDGRDMKRNSLRNTFARACQGLEDRNKVRIYDGKAWLIW
jgi:hypothetical protein